MNQVEAQQELNDAVVPGTFGGAAGSISLPGAMKTAQAAPDYSDDRLSNNSASYYNK